MALPLFDTAPYRGRTSQSRHASYTGARKAQAPSQAKRMLQYYLAHGPSTDHAVAVALGLPEGRISARRSQLIATGCVAYVDLVDGEFGAKNCRWDLTVKGTAIAQTVT